jgi:hypothetical protein
MVRWNAGTGHVKPHRQTLSPAGPKIEIQKGFTHDEYREVGQRVPISPPTPHEPPSVRCMCYTREIPWASCTRR